MPNPLNRRAGGCGRQKNPGSDRSGAVVVVVRTQSLSADSSSPNSNANDEGGRVHLGSPDTGILDLAGSKSNRPGPGGAKKERPSPAALYSELECKRSNPNRASSPEGRGGFGGRRGRCRPRCSGRSCGSPRARDAGPRIVRRAYWLARGRSAGDAGDADSSFLWCVGAASVSRGGARFSARPVCSRVAFGHRPGRLPPAATRGGQIGPAPLVRFRACVPFSTRRPRRTVRERPAPGPSRCGVFRRRHPSLRSVRPCGFWRLASPVRSLRCVGDAARAGHSWPPFFSAHVTGPRIGLLSRPGRDVWSRRRSWDFCPSQFRSRPRVIGVFRRLAPTCRFALGPPRVSSSRGPPVTADRWARGRGSWGLAPRTSRAVRPAGPAKAFARWAGQVHQPGLPWALRPLSGVRSPASGLHFWSHSARAFRSTPRGASAGSRRGVARALRRCEGPTTGRSGGVSDGSASLSEVFAPTA